MLATLPTFLSLIFLMLLGAVSGGFVNWAVCRWAWEDRRISPWMEHAKDEPQPSLLSRIPVVGWLFRRDPILISKWGRWFWVRPMIIEIGLACLFPWLYLWLSGGGLTEGVAPIAWMAEIWFWVYAVMLALMAIGTFIDFDEKTIPDQVTVTGTLFALIVAAVAPSYRLPVVVAGLAKVPTIESIHFQSPNKLDNISGIHLGIPGLAIALGIFVFWVFALWPKLSPFYVGLRKSFRFSWAYSIRPKRKTKSSMRIQSRKFPIFTATLIAILTAGTIAISTAWSLISPVQWESLFGALAGLAFGMCMVWGIRIVGTFAMQKEAMGFGDVTLMAMIGAFLGWQATLVAFVIGIFLACLAVILQFLITGNKAFPFGPYLCGGAVVTVWCWNEIWQRTSFGVFRLGPWLIAILLFCLVMMAVMLFCWSWLRGDFAEEAA
ncbi:MAG: A24 family peptidase [Planctomycetota bacterium]